MKHEDILDFAISAISGRVVDIREVERGKNCNCLCPSCGRKVVTKKGPIRRHHFAHSPKDKALSPCSGGPETGLHRAAKQIIAAWSQLTLPELLFSMNVCDRFGRVTQISDAIPREHFRVDSSILPDVERCPGDWMPDVILKGPKGEVRIEIKVTNGISSDKKAKIDRDAIPTLEYDLSSFRATAGWTLASLEHALRTDPGIVSWVFHPDFAALRQRIELRARQYGDSDSPIGRTKETIRTTPAPSSVASSAEWGNLVFHPWFGLIPADPEKRKAFIAMNFHEMHTFDLRGDVTIKIKKHAVLADSWLVSFYDSQNKKPRAGIYDSLFSEHLRDKALNSSYFGFPNIRAVYGTKTIEPMLEFVTQHKRTDEISDSRSRNHVSKKESGQPPTDDQQVRNHLGMEPFTLH